MKCTTVKSTILYCTLLFSCHPALAQSEPGRFELTPFGGFGFGGTFDDSDSDRRAELDDAAHLGLIFDIRQSSNTQLEILYSRQSTDAEITGSAISTQNLDLDVHYLQAGGTYQGDGDKVRPYLAATIGAAHFDVRNDGFDSETYFAFSIGPGIQVWPNDRFGLRLEARVFGSLIRSDSELFCLSDPGGGEAACALTATGDVLWQTQTTVGVVFRF